ncbi:MAG: hypothetical protein WAV82_15290 [Methylobacter sp.]
MLNNTVLLNFCSGSHHVLQSVLKVLNVVKRINIKQAVKSRKNPRSVEQWNTGSSVAKTNKRIVKTVKMIIFGNNPAIKQRVDSFHAN